MQSSKLAVREAVDVIEFLPSEDEIGAFIEGDDRKTVIRAARARIAALRQYRHGSREEAGVFLGRGVPQTAKLRHCVRNDGGGALGLAFCEGITGAISRKTPAMTFLAFFGTLVMGMILLLSLGELVFPLRIIRLSLLQNSAYTIVVFEHTT